MTNVHLVTGYAGNEHITSADQGSFNAAFIGKDNYIMDVGSKFAASIISNNTVRVLDGDILMQGRHIRIEPGLYKDINIETGMLGTMRKDLIVMEYSKNAFSGIETAEIKVIKGTATTNGNPQIPAYENGSILDGDSISQMPLYEVTINEVVLSNIKALFTITKNVKTLTDEAIEVFETETEKAMQDIAGDLIQLQSDVEGINKLINAKLIETILDPQHSGYAYIYTFSNVVIIHFDSWLATGSASDKNIFSYSTTIKPAAYKVLQPISNATIQIKKGTRDILLTTSSGKVDGAVIFVV